MKPTSEPITSFTTNSFSENPMNVIGMAMGAGMGIMFITIFIGAPIFIAMAGLLGGILLVYGYKIGRTTYTLYPEGIYQSIALFIPTKMGKKPKERFFEWQQIKSYKNDTDMKRSMEQYEFIKLYVKGAPGQVWITDEKNKEGFELFRDEFLRLMQRKDPEDVRVPEVGRSSDVDTGTVHSAKVQTAVKSVSEEAKIENSTSHIKQKKSFYKGAFAMVLTIFFLLLCVALFAFGIISGMRFTNWFRLLLILLPGTAYMFYRVFVKD